MSAGSLNPVELPKDPHDWAAWAKDLTTGFNDLQGDSKSNTEKQGSAGDPTTPQGKTSNSPYIDPMFRKKGNVIYHRDAGYKTRVNGDGTHDAVFDNTPANDTFPRNKIAPSYTYLH